MSAVETVRGPVEVAALGRTLMHEHVFVMQPEALQNFGNVWGPCYWDEDARVADAIEKLRAVRGAGIETVVDATAYGLGRNVQRLQRINARRAARRNIACDQRDRRDDRHDREQSDRKEDRGHPAQDHRIAPPGRIYLSRSAALTRAACAAASRATGTRNGEQDT